MATIQIYKRGQGKHTRIATFVSAMVLGVLGARLLSEQLGVYFGPYLQFGLPSGLVITLGALMFWVVNRARSADFLIATEGEMKKVSWSSRKEVIGSTKVVIVTTFIMAGLLFAVDLLFNMVFRLFGIVG